MKLIGGVGVLVLTYTTTLKCNGVVRQCLANVVNTVWKKKVKRVLLESHKCGGEV